MIQHGDSIEKIPEIIGELYAIVGRLEELFPGRLFTPDGHLVGSIGEVIAAHRYGLDLFAHSTKGHDARAKSGVLVEIKATQGLSIALREEPVHLIVLQLLKSGQAQEVFNGPGFLPWVSAGAMQRNGQRSISLFKLRSLMTQIPEASRLPMRTPGNSHGSTD